MIFIQCYYKISKIFCKVPKNKKFLQIMLRCKNVDYSSETTSRHAKNVFLFLSVCLSFRPSIRLSVYLSLSFFLSFCVSFFLFLFLSFFLPIFIFSALRSCQLRNYLCISIHKSKSFFYLCVSRVIFVSIPLFRHALFHLL